MSNNTVTKASELSGLFIYQDPKRGTVFYDILTRKGYVLTSSDVKKYVLYSSTFSIAIAIAVLAHTLFHLPISYAVILFAFIYILSELIFRFTFFYKLPVAENWTPNKKDNLVTSFAKNYSKARLIILIVLLLILTILMPIYAKVSNLDQLSTIGAYIVSAITAIFAIINIIALITKNKNNL